MLPPEPPIHLTSPAHIAGIVPYLLHFHPTDSLVVIALTGQRITFGAPTALPASPSDDGPFRAAMDYLAAIMVTQHITGALLVGYGSTERVAAAVAAATAALTAVNVPVHDAQRVTEGRIVSLVCTDPRCCPPQGIPFDPTSNLAAVKATAAGMVALPDRAAVADQVAPLTGAAREEFAEATRAAVDRVTRHLDGTAPSPSVDLLGIRPGQVSTDDGRRIIAAGMATYRAGRVLDTEQAALLTVLLRLSIVYDVALACCRDDDWQISMWTDLTRRAEPGYVARPAILLALAALQDGNGVLADCAIRRALDAEPANRLASLLLQAIRAGVDPHTAARLVRS